jgi:capsular polysaccharide export protein
MRPDFGTTNTDAGASQRRRLFVYNGGFLTQRRVARILKLSGYDIRLGIPKLSDPKDTDLIGLWGHSPTAHRGEAVAENLGQPILRVEDAFLRSILPGRDGQPPLGLTLDRKGMHYDPAQPSELEDLLATHPLDDTALMNRARGAIAELQSANLSKYNSFELAEPCPDPGYVLVIDQTLNDAAVTKSGADRATFLEMLVFAQEEHPGKRVIIKTHPDTLAGHRQGYFQDSDANHNVTLFAGNVSPWTLLDGAAAVYTVSSQMGFEAIFAGHNPRVFGQPFYAGWGLTRDERPVQRRQRKLSRAQLFAAAMFLYPKWYDPYRDRLCDLETAITALAAQTRAWREDKQGWTASNMRLWKRRPLQKFFGTQQAIKFTNDPAEIETATTQGRRHMLWASAASDAARTDSLHLEDGFLRSRGLGAELVPPLSLVLDDLGIYYDPTRPIRLEDLVFKRTPLRPDQSLRVQNLISALTAHRLSKYNTGSTALDALPEGRKILIPGQVEDDASIRKGTKSTSTNLALLQAARNAHPDAILLYKPHPDVETGLRNGKIPEPDQNALADAVLNNINAIDAIEASDEVWTMTSLLGFEALLRGKPVTCLGAPFYAGWGLTTDLDAVPARRGHGAPLEALVHAALIDYPRYFDPVSGLPCPVEVALDRLASGHTPRRGPVNRALSKLQGLLASRAHLWR